MYRTLIGTITFIILFVSNISFASTPSFETFEESIDKTPIIVQGFIYGTKKNCENYEQELTDFSLNIPTTVTRNRCVYTYKVGVGKVIKGNVNESNIIVTSTIGNASNFMSGSCGLKSGQHHWGPGYVIFLNDKDGKYTFNSCGTNKEIYTRYEWLITKIVPGEFVGFSIIVMNRIILPIFSILIILFLGFKLKQRFHNR